MSRRQFKGKVVSDRMQRTLVVEVSWVQHHSKYQKVMRRVTRLYVHDPKGLGKLGDLVRVTECRPISRTKRFLLTEIVKRGVVVEEAVVEAAVQAVTAPEPALQTPVAVAVASEGAVAEVAPPGESATPLPEPGVQEPQGPTEAPEEPGEARP